jgi:16S rRNA (uracil1498-N3)-methyltransferase
LPILATPITFENFFNNYKATQQLIAHCEPADKINIKKLIPNDNCILLIGPEGDFSPQEIEKAKMNNFEAIDLGPTRLRTETAGIFAISVLKKN